MTQPAASTRPSTADGPVPALKFFETRQSVRRDGLRLHCDDGFALASDCHGRVVVDQVDLDLFAAQLQAYAAENPGAAYLHEEYVKALGGNSGRLLGV